MKQLPNIITMLRMASSFCLLFCGGVGAPNEIVGNAKLQEAYELGKQV